MKTWAKVGLGCGVLLVLGVAAFIALSVIGARQYSDEYGYGFERQFGGGVFFGDRPAVREAAAASGIPTASIPEAKDLRHALIYSYDEFKDRGSYTVDEMPLSSDSPLKASLLMSFSGREPKPDERHSLGLTFYVMQPEMPIFDYARLIVDGTAFALQPNDALGSFSDGSEKMGDEWYSFIAIEVGPRLAEWIGQADDVRLRCFEEELIVSDDAKATFLEFARLMR